MSGLSFSSVHVWSFKASPVKNLMQRLRASFSCTTIVDLRYTLSYGIVTPPGVPHIEGSVTNKTACLDGYWKRWCDEDLSLCAKFVMSNVFPGVFANNQTSVQICLKDAGDKAPNNDTNNILSPLSKLCGGTIAETSPPVWKTFQDNSTNWGIETQSANTNTHF